MAGKRTGRVRWLREAKGYGFLAPDGSDEEIFFLLADVVKGGAPLPGEAVAFAVVEDEGGRRAVDIEALPPPGTPASPVTPADAGESGGR